MAFIEIYAIKVHIWTPYYQLALKKSNKMMTIKNNLNKMKQNELTQINTSHKRVWEHYKQRTKKKD